MLSDHSSLGSELYVITNYKFKNETLLFEVFRPKKNALSPWSYERLEFLGDSVLNLVVSIIIFELYPLEAEGQLTLRKNDLVSGHKLSEICNTLDLMKFISGALGQSLWRDSDTLEALIGAIFIDGGFENAKTFILRNWKKLAQNLHTAPLDAKTRLNIWTQKRQLPLPKYEVTDNFHKNGTFTVMLWLKNTHGFGTVKVTNGIKKLGEILAAEFMLCRIENREEWNTLLRSDGEYITDKTLLLSQEDLKMRLNLWCKANKIPLPCLEMVEKIIKNKIQYKATVVFSNGRFFSGTSTQKTIAERKAVLKSLLRLCDEKRESVILKNKTKHYEIDLCVPKNFKSLLDEWVAQNHMGEVNYVVQELDSKKLYNVSLTIPGSDLGTVYTTAITKKLGEQSVTGLMIEKIIKLYGSRKRDEASYEANDPNRYKNELYKWTQSRSLPKPEYKVENVTGLSHNLLFTVSVSVAGQDKKVSSGYTKQAAQQKAASLMVKQIQLSVK